jgi:apolipoprotein N-acyltransferase
VLRALPHAFLAGVGGALLFLSFPPPDVGWLAFIAFVPLLVAVGRAPGPVGAALCGALAGAVAYLPSFAWVASVAVPGWLGLAAYVALYVVAAGVGAWFLQRSFPAAWPVPAAALWTALEVTRAHLGPGFPWLFLGYTQYRSTALVQLAAWGGVYAVGFLVFFVNGAVAAVVLGFLRGRAERRRLWRPAAVLAVAGCMVAVCAVLGERWREAVPTWEGPVVGAVQQNIPRLVSEIYGADAPADPAREIVDEVQLCAQLTARLRGRGVRLAVWPESTFRIPIYRTPGAFLVLGEQHLLDRMMAYVQAVGRDMDCHLLIGAPSLLYRDLAVSAIYGVSATEQFANGVAFLDPAGSLLGHYDKIRLVPFGEYIPLVDDFPFLALLTPIGRGITAGKETTVFRLPAQGGGGSVRFGALVCYEDVFPDLCAAFRRKGAQCLINVTDEGWYYVPGELRQHLAMAVFRAVETRTCVVRAANTGISCFISPLGEVYAELKPLTRDALAAPLVLSDAVTPYVRWGDTFAVSCLVLVLGVPLLVATLRRGGRAAA